MGVSYKKSFRLSKNTRINISKDGGIGFSTGFKGFRISKNNEGTRITVGKDGVYYTKYFGKKKKLKNKEKSKEKNKDKKRNQLIEDTTEEVMVEEVINPETDFEKVPTQVDDILLYLGSKSVDYLLYIYFGLVIIGTIIYFIRQDTVTLSILGGLALLTLMHIFISKRNNFINDLNRSIKLFDQEKNDKCFKKLDRCLKTMPKDHKALLLMIFTTFRLEKYTDCLSFIEEYKKHHELFEVIYFIEAVCLTETSKYEEAILAIEKVYSEDDEVKFAKYKILGDSFLGLGNINKAIMWYEKLPLRSKTMDDDIATYKYAIGKAYFLSGNHKKAFTYLSSVYDYKPDYKDVRDLVLTKLNETVI